MNCQEALNLLYDIIDKEASEIDIRQVEEHLRHCHDCSGIYRVERSVNELIRERLAHQDVTPRLDSLRTKILSELDAIDCEAGASEPPKKKLSESPAPTGFGLGRIMAIAASVIVIVGAFIVGKTIFNDHQAYLPFEEAHWVAAENLDPYRDAAITTTALAATRQALAYDLVDQVGSFVLVGGHAESVDDVPVTHFVYHNETRVVSVFVIDAGLLTLPDDLLETLVVRNGIEFYDHNCRGCRLVYHRVGDALIVTATTEHDIELLDFVPDRNPV
jgi:hypothetical protein